MKSQAQGRARLHRLAAAAASVAFLAATAACTAKVEQKAPEEAVKTEQSAQSRQHWRGPVQVVLDTTRKVGNLTPAQSQTLDTLARELDEDRDGRRELHEKLRVSAAAVVRSGSADSKEFDQSVSEAVQAVEQRMQKSTDALEELHGILAPEQRSKVAAALRSRIAEKFGRAKSEERHREGVKQLASDLMLSKLQIDQLTTIKKELYGEKRELRPSREELLALVDAFESDDFRTPVNAFREKKLALLKSRVADAGRRTDAVLAIFTPEQRELLADLILDGPDKVLLGDEHGQTQAR